MGLTSTWDKELLAMQTFIDKNHVFVWNILRVGAFWMEGQVKDEMPVDTGRARASWGHLVMPVPESELSDPVWIEDEANLKITEGSNVEYIEYLNEGSSIQAPAGFLDRIEERAADKVADDILQANVDRWGSP